MEFIGNVPTTWVLFFVGILFLWTFVGAVRTLYKWHEEGLQWTSYRKFQVLGAICSGVILLILLTAWRTAGEVEEMPKSKPEGVQEHIRAAPPERSDEELKEAAEKRREEEIPTRTLEESTQKADDYLEKAIQRSKENK